MTDQALSMHEYFMRQALILAEQARFHAPPNPWVGCVIVKNQQIIGRGYTLPPGQAHAEVNALNQAQEQAKGASLYATLEPCSHYGRTPPCVNAIIQAGIKQVYIAQEDPDPRVQGQGIRRLREAGIEVFTDICKKEAQQALLPYLYQRQTGLPYTIVKIAASLDGRTAAEDKTSQWITSPEARQDVHAQRARSQAILVGSGTALADRPQLTARHPLISLSKQPLRILIDSKGRVPARGPLFDLTLAPTLVITSPAAAENRRREWEKTGAEVCLFPLTDEGHLNLTEIWSALGQRGILQLLVEGGSTLQTALLKHSLFNNLLLYLGPLLLGSTGLPLFLDRIPTLEKATRFHLCSIERLGDSIKLVYTPATSQIKG